MSNPRPTDPGATAALAPAEWTTADTALWCYLFLPALIFLAGFFRPALGLPLAAIAAMAAAFWLHGVAADGTGRARRGEIATLGMLALLAAGWAALGGAGHLFHANPDWVSRFAVLRDLVVMDWPPRYGDGLGGEVVLRAPLGYYLPAALLARGLGLNRADLLLLLWTWLGTALFFAASFGGSRRQRLAGATLFVFASGLDAIGAWAASGMPPRPGMHIEWWAGSLQYSSNSTLLFWVPSHALAGWIPAAWLWRFRRSPRFLMHLPILFFPVMLWSPLPALGLLPLAVAAIAAQWRTCLPSSDRRAELIKSLALAILPATAIGGYLSMNATAIASGTLVLTAPNAPPEQYRQIGAVLYFIVLEAGIFAAFALLLERSALLVASLVVLAGLPWISFGPNNDLAMRGSVPALAILWLVIIAELVADPVQRRLSHSMRTTLAVLFLIGAVTPSLEIYRALSGNPWQPDPALAAPAALGGVAAHYFAPSNDSWLQSGLRR